MAREEAHRCRHKEKPTASKLSERFKLTAAALTGLLANPDSSSVFATEADNAVCYADATLARLKEKSAETKYHDAVQRLCEAAELIAELRAHVKAVLDAGMELHVD